VRKRSIASPFYTNFLHCSVENRRNPAMFSRASRLQMHAWHGDADC